MFYAKGSRFVTFATSLYFSQKNMSGIDLSRVPAFYHNYIGLVAETDLKKAFQLHETELIQLLNGIPEEKWDHRYAEGKWSIKELVQHMIDAERIFCNRALRFARKDSTELPGFDENLFAETSGAAARNKKDLVDEMATVQKSSSQLFNSFDNEQMEQSGISNGKSIYVKAIGFIIIGHVIHHRNILLERYLN